MQVEQAGMLICGVRVVRHEAQPLLALGAAFARQVAQHHHPIE